jgi:tRNA 2-thiouridine synthesizing protein A
MTHREPERRGIFGRKRRPGGHRRQRGSYQSPPATATSAASPAAPPGEPAPTLTIDALGRKCPIPIIMLAERISLIEVGEIVAVLADDVAAKTDIPAWCRMKSQEFVRDIPLERGWAFHIRRSY